MVGPVRKMPSINIPFVDNQGRMNPTWYEFLRAFLATAVTTSDPETIDALTVIAGPGLIEDTNDGISAVTLAVGAGNGLAVNANDVSIDIANQTKVPVSLEDEMLFSDINDNNTLRKTSLRDMGNLIGAAPGGDNTQIQYNNNNFFAGDTGFTTDGAGSVNIVGDLDVDNINLNGNTITTTNTNGDLSLSANGTGTLYAKNHVKMDSNIYIIGAGGSATNGPRFEITSAQINMTQVASSPQVDFAGGSGSNGSFLMRLKNSGNITFASDDSGVLFTKGSGALPLRRTTATTITASTTQTQGQMALTADINEVSTVANANDVVTLPAALAGRHCLVINNGANTLQVFPASGDDLGAGVNTSTTIVAGSRKWFVAFDTVNWEPVI